MFRLGIRGWPNFLFISVSQKWGTRRASSWQQECSPIRGNPISAPQLRQRKKCDLTMQCLDPNRSHFWAISFAFFLDSVNIKIFSKKTSCSISAGFREVQFCWFDGAALAVKQRVWANRQIQWAGAQKWLSFHLRPQRRRDSVQKWRFVADETNPEEFGVLQKAHSQRFLQRRWRTCCWVRA